MTDESYNRVERTVRAAVVDTAIGIKARDVAEPFQAFRQGGRIMGNDGTGLGLADRKIAIR